MIHTVLRLVNSPLRQISLDKFTHIQIIDVELETGGVNRTINYCPKNMLFALVSK